MTLTTRGSVLAAAILVAAAPFLAAQCPPAAWASMNQLPGVDASVLALTTWDPDGTGPASPELVAGGTFTAAGNVAAQRIARWNGATWQPLGAGLGGPDVTALAVYNGDVVAGQSLDTFTSTAQVSRWNGSAWSPVGTGMNSNVRALAVYGGDLIAGGEFTAAGGTIASRIARWSGSAWLPLGSGLGGAPQFIWQVSALCVYNGELVAAGVFQTAGGVPAANIARWNGSSWQPLGSGTDATVQSLAVYNGDLIAAGQFSSADGVPAPKIARWDGVSWHALGSGLACSFLGSCVGYSLTTYNGELIAGGAFNMAGGGTATAIARWNGALWQPVGSGIDCPSIALSTGCPVRALCAFGGELVAGGSFVSAGGTGSSYVSRWNGGSWQPLGAGMPYPVRALTQFGEDLVVGGFSFPASGGVARWNGSDWQPVGPGVNAAPMSLAVYNGEIIGGGSFAGAGGPHAIARWSGSTWAPLGPGVTFSVTCLALHNGDLIAAGSSSGSPIARWDGTSWHALGTNGPTGTVNALGVYNGDLIAGGQFSLPAAGWVNVARWDGTSWSPLGSGVNNAVTAFALFNGELVAGGWFTQAGGASSPVLARWNGASWLPFPAPVSGIVSALIVYGGDLVAYGVAFPANGGVIGIGRFDGTTWHVMGSGTSPVGAFAVYGGALIAGGSFTSAGGIPSAYVARWSQPFPHLHFSQPNGNGTGVLVHDTWLIPGHEYFTLASADLCPAGAGTGPWGGLCFNDPAALWQQIALPVGAAPFHFVAPAADVAFGPYALPVGFAFEALAVDVTGGAIGCLSPAHGFVVY